MGKNTTQAVGNFLHMNIPSGKVTDRKDTLILDKHRSISVESADLADQLLHHPSQKSFHERLKSLDDSKKGSKEALLSQDKEKVLQRDRSSKKVIKINIDDSAEDLERARQLDDKSPGVSQ